MRNYTIPLLITEDRLPTLRAVIDRLEAMGCRVTRHGRHQARAQCPVHGGNRLNLSIGETDRGVFFRCWSRGCTPRDIRDALGLGGPAPKPRAGSQIRPPDTGRQRANADDLDRVHRALLARLPLSLQHRQNLRERGLNDDQISSGCYRTFSIEGRPQMARDLIDQFGEQLCESVPGFVRKEAEDRRWWTLAGSAGLLIPVRDIEHRIRALKIRADGDSRGPRYSWMSSVRYGGPSPGAPPHVPIYTTPGRVVRVSEGELKGDIATCLSGLLTLGIAGVSQWHSAISLLLTSDTIRRFWF